MIELPWTQTGMGLGDVDMRRASRCCPGLMVREAGEWSMTSFFTPGLWSVQ